MGFKHPEFLYFLLVALIPVIIHLFNFRRYKKLLFSNIEFLKNITTQTRKQNKLKHLLVLLSRILAIIFLVLAFAGPESKKNKEDAKSGELVNAIYLDNSFSMMSVGENGRLIDEAIDVARELVHQAPRSTQFLLATNNTSRSQRILSKEAVLSEFDILKVTPSTKKLSSVLKDFNNVKDERYISNMELFVLSDFQKKDFDISSFPGDTVSSYYFVPFAPIQKRNIFIDSCWMSSPVLLPGKKVELSIRVRNSSEVDFEKIPLKLTINKKQKAVAAVDVSANDFTIISVSITPEKSGWQAGRVEIEDYPVTFDDAYYFAFRVSNRIKVLEVYSTSESLVLQQFYNSDSIFEFDYTNFRQLNYNRLGDYNLIVLNAIPAYSSGFVNQVAGYVNNGGTVLYIPTVDSDFGDDNQMLAALNAGRIARMDTSRTRVVGIKPDHELFRDIITNIPENADLPEVFSHINYTYTINSGVESLVTLLDGHDFLLTKKLGNGRIYQLCMPISDQFSNFSTQALFVPIMYGIATQRDILEELAHTIGSNKSVRADIGGGAISETPFTLKSEDTEYSFIPMQKSVSGKLILEIKDGITQSGIYELVLNDSVYAVFGFNYSRQESIMEFYQPDELNDNLETSGLRFFEVLENTKDGYTEVINSLQKESELWKLFIIFALLMLLVEIVILRFWK